MPFKNFNLGTARGALSCCVKYLCCWVCCFPSRLEVNKLAQFPSWFVEPRAGSAPGSVTIKRGTTFLGIVNVNYYARRVMTADGTRGGSRVRSSERVSAMSERVVVCCA